jgi:acetyl esterase/lipase
MIPPRSLPPIAWHPTLLWLVAAIAVLSVPACRVTDVPLWSPAPPSQTEAQEVESVRDIAYYEGPNADPRHRLDLFLPRGQKGYPVLLLVHGGFWLYGDNRCSGLYPAVAECLARQGIGVALPNYRLSPGVKHPEHIRDVARAVAWVHAHIADYGGRPDQLFVAGHSAGGHLAALLGTDETYLRAQGLRGTDITGVIGISGVYRIPEGKMEVTLGGDSPQAFRLSEVAPVRGTTNWSWADWSSGPSLALSVNVFGPAFGNDPQVRADASPVNHVRPGLPPFLILSAEKDLPTLPKMAEEFHQALVEQGCEAEFLRVAGRNHNSIVFRAVEPEDPVARAVRDFIRSHTVNGTTISRGRNHKTASE